MRSESEETRETRLRAMLTVGKTDLPGAPTPLSGMRDAVCILIAGCAVGAVIARAI